MSDRRNPRAPQSAEQRRPSEASSVTPPGVVSPDTQREGREEERGDQSQSGLLGQLIADRYEVKYKIGSGGMGSVYYAEHILMRKPVAVKVLHPELTVLPEIVARFEREAIAAGRLNDAHIVTATDFGRLEDGAFYLALEYIEGTGLAEVIADGPLPSLRALKIARQILKALGAAHAAGIVHRDLKPENVMLVKRSDEPDFVKVLDFGIAKIGFDEKEDLPGGALTRMGSIFGTPQYMAPEQAAGQAVDHRADLYTLGILLYEMLSGRVPFTADSVGRVLAMHLTQPVPPLPDDVPERVGRFVMALLEKMPDDRLQSAEAAIQQLDQALGALGVSHPSFAFLNLEELELGAPAHPPPARNRSAVPFLVGAVLMLIVVVPIVAVTTMRLSNTPTARPAASSSLGVVASAQELDPKLAALLARAATGNVEALAELEARPEEQRVVDEWMALARGRMATGKLPEGIAAYDRALAADPALAADRSLLAQVREAAKYASAGEPALRLAASRLGSDGADLLYDVWVATKAKTRVTALAKALVYSAEVRSRASPALAVALKLREAETCEEFERLLGEVTLNGDRRVVRILLQLQARTGCGKREQEDCYPCLRDEESSAALTNALAIVRNKSAPTFAP